MKKLLAILLATATVLSLCACGGGISEEAGGAEAAAETTDSGKTAINVMAFTDEVPNMLKKYCELNPEFGDKYEIKETIIATTDGLYQPALDQALQAGGNEAPDIYAAEAAFVLKYTQGDASSFAAGYDELGIDVDAALDEAQIAQYTVDIGTRPSDSKLVGLGYQSTGGGFIYRRSIANEVFGTDDPDEIGKIIGAGSGSWDKFFEAAEKLKQSGYAIVSGDGDIWHAVENSSPTGWIVDGKLNIDPAREEFLDLSKKLADNGYFHDTVDWQEGWFADMKKDGGVFGFYGPAWLINYTLADNCGEGDESSFGDWAVCEPNVGFFWGGTWVLANKEVVGTEKQDAVKELINWITLDPSETGLQYYWANGTLNGEGGTKDDVASATVLENSNGEMEFLGGQDMFEVFVPANEYANGKNLTQYDESINTWWRDAVRQYRSGQVDRDGAIALLKQQVADNLDVTVE